ncbi:MAG: transcription antitermination factor NusB [Veillonellaceae bacterium]|nr:transcription antitermination factor NusB [Veillonellaceae bacterium]
MSRHEARLQALQVLYTKELNPRSEGTHVLLLTAEDVADEPVEIAPYAAELAAAVTTHRAEIDALIMKHSHRWDVRRMHLVDALILRLAVAELHYLKTPDVTKAVVIDEALEIAKVYGEPAAVPFVNGILDAALEDNA